MQRCSILTACLLIAAAGLLLIGGQNTASAAPPAAQAAPRYEIVHVDFPRNSTVGDVNSVVCTLRNNESQGRQYDVVLSFTGVMRVLGSGTRSIYLGPNSTGRVSWRVETISEGNAEIAIDVDPLP